MGTITTIMSNKAAAEAKAKGNAFFLKKQYPEAIEWYTKAIKADPNDSTFYSNRCAAYMGLDKFNEALGDAEMCIKLQPAWVKGWYRKGAALMSLSRYEEAAMAFREGGSALNAAELAKEEGNALFRHAKYEQAIEKY